MAALSSETSSSAMVSNPTSTQNGSHSTYPMTERHSAAIKKIRRENAPTSGDGEEMVELLPKTNPKAAETTMMAATTTTTTTTTTTATTITTESDNISEKLTDIKIDYPVKPPRRKISSRFTAIDVEQQEPMLGDSKEKESVSLKKKKCTIASHV